MRTALHYGKKVRVRGEDDKGQVILGIDSHGALQIFDENHNVFFEGKWQIEAAETQLVIYNNFITELKVSVVYTGVGMNS